MARQQSLSFCLVSREYPPETGGGGIGTYTYHLAHGLAARGHRVHVVAMADGAETAKRDGAVAVHRIRNLRIPTPFLGRRFIHAVPRVKYNLRVRAKVAELKKNFGIDVIESANFAAETVFCSGMPGLVSGVRLVTPLSTVLETQGMKLNLDLRFSCWLERLQVERAGLVVGISRAIESHLAREYRIHPARMRHCPLGIPLPDVPEGDRRTAGSDPLLLFVGTLSRRKGVPLLLQAMRRVLREVPRARLVLVGRDPRMPGGRSFLETELAELDDWTRSRIMGKGFVDARTLHELLIAADVFVMPSFFESFGQVYLEAMAYRVPVVALAIPSAREVVDQGRTGFLVDRADPDALAAPILTLLRDADLRREMGREGRRRVEKHFTVEQMAETTERIYREALGDGP